MTFVDMPDYAVGENVIRVVQTGRRARLEDGVLVVYTDSDPVAAVVVKSVGGSLTVK
ncbi:MAG: hypothetical protein FWD58_07725 [Firmicutes bacterium]|nr:hypothetical protein [Bacillota bacterium]